MDDKRDPELSETTYYAEMKSLETHNQDIHNHLTAGGFTVQLGADNPFGRIPVDQTIEETINKDTNSWRY